MVGSEVRSIVKVVKIRCKFALKEGFGSFPIFDVKLSSGKVIVG